MGAPIRVLLVEDSPPDAELVLRELRRSGFSPQHLRVDSKPAMVAALKAADWDLVIGDYSIPGFSGTAALEALRLQDPDTPFIFVSGTIGEETAVAAMRAGAQDYVLKGSLARLGPAIERELREAEERRARRHAEEELRFSEQRFRDLFHNAPVALYRMLPLGEIVDANAAMVAMLGYPSRETLLRRRAGDLFVDEIEYDRLMERLEDTGLVSTERVLLIRHDGREIMTSCSFRLVRDGGGRVLHTEGAIVDVTERWKAERALVATQERLRGSELRYRTLVEGSVYGVIIHQAGLIVFANPAAARLFGFERPEDFVARHFWDFVVPEDMDSLLAYETARMAGAPAPTQMEFCGLTSTGTRLALDCTVSPVVWDGRSATFLSIGDLRERKHLEEQARRSQKLEAVGRLAGGIAHDFHNLLTVIIGEAQLAQVRGTLDPDTAESLSQIEQAGERGTALTRQLLAFSRRDAIQPVVMTVDELVTGMQSMIGRLLGAGFELVTRLESGGALVRVDKGQFEQVLMNLVVNARDAMPGGGRLTIATSVVTDGSPLVGPDGRGSFAALIVRDTGHGIPSHVKERLFEPFFTTKEAGQGTGLGLATSYGIVRQAGGTIEVESQAGAGATFRVLLPVADESAGAPDPAGT